MRQDDRTPENHPTPYFASFDQRATGLRGPRGYLASNYTYREKLGKWGFRR
jgi:hypothetical protein